MIRTQVRLRETQYRALKELAARRHTSVAELIRQAVDWLLETSGTVPPEERYRRALSIIGAFRSGQSDISTHHDEYLDEVYGREAVRRRGDEATRQWGNEAARQREG